MKKIVLLFLMLNLVQHTAFSEIKTIDSLKTALQNAKSDSVRLRLYLALGEACEKEDNMFYAEPALKLVDKLISQVTDEPIRKKLLQQESEAFYLMTVYYTNNKNVEWNKIIDYAERHLKYIESKGNKKRIAETLAIIANLVLFSNDTTKFIDYQVRSIALFIEIKDAPNVVERFSVFCSYYLRIGNDIKALESIQTAIAISNELNYKTGAAQSLAQLADIYRDNGEDERALENYQSALLILNEAKDTNELFNVMAAMGGFHYTRHNTSKAIEYYNKLIVLCGAKNDIGHSVASVYKWIGIVYKDDGDFTNALSNFEKSLSLFDSLKYFWQINDVLNEMGMTYNKKGDFAKAIEYHLKGIKIAEEAMSENEVARSKFLLAQDFFGLKNYKSAKQYSDQGLAFLKKQFDIKLISEAELLASQIDFARGDGINAYLHFKEYVSLNNKLKGEEIRKAAQKEKFKNEFDKQKVEQEKKDAIALKELQKEKLVRNGFIGGFAAMVLFAGIFFTQRNKIKKGKKRSDELLLNILPEEVAEELKTKGSAEAKQFDDVTVIFTDFKGFTQLSENLTPKELVAEINECFSAFDHIMQKHGVEKIKTIGDAYMAAGGIPISNNTHPFDVVNAALDIQQFMKEHSEKKEAAGKLFFEIRIGVHTGAVVAGIVGVKKFAYDIWGDTVNTASRMESSGEAGKVNISGSTYELVKDKFNCIHRGKITAKGKGEIDMYFVEATTIA